MRLPSFRALWLGLAVSASVAVPALAQAPACERYRAELASLDTSGGGRSGQYAAAAQRQRAEIQRTVDYARSLGCDRPRLPIFGDPPPPQCGGLNARIDQMQGNLRELQAQANGDGVEARRRFLMAAIDQTCNPPRQRGFFESLFGGPDQSQPMSPSDGIVDPNQPVQTEAQPRLGGGKIVCVRTCDGSFFPLSSSPGGRSGADEMCQALCPGVETQAFSMGDQINNAVSLNGQPYSALANALKYTRSYDSACTCKKGDQSWAQVLANAESLIDKRKTDIYVTEAKAEELSRGTQTAQATKPDPKADARQKASDKAKADAAAKAADAATAQEAVEEAATGAAAPTASQDSAGIGPKAVDSAKVIGVTEGQRKQVTLPNGEKRMIRVIGPGSAAPALQ